MITKEVKLYNVGVSVVRTTGPWRLRDIRTEEVKKSYVSIQDDLKGGFIKH